MSERISLFAEQRAIRLYPIFNEFIQTKKFFENYETFTITDFDENFEGFRACFETQDLSAK